jgi:hypothetical protein
MPLFYPSKNHGRLNRRPFVPEAVTGTAMCNPHYANLLDKDRPDAPPLLHGTRVIDDSGAFQEDDMLTRLSPDAALDRQLRHEQRLRDDGCGPNFHFEAVVTYDMLVGVDEALVDGKRIKRRGNEDTAAEAVRQTIASAEAYRRRRDDVAGVIAYAAQGATLRQYVGCVQALLDLMRPGQDWLALGGFCIIGLQPSLKPLFAEVCRHVAPMLRRKGIRRTHILGVCVCDALVVAVQEFARYGIEVSTDSSSIEVNSTMGKVWAEEHMSRKAGGASPWRKVYGKHHKYADGGYHPADLAHMNIRAFSSWLASLGGASAEEGRPPVKPIPHFQCEMLW